MFNQLLDVQSVAGSVLVLCLVATVGLTLGSFQFQGIRLGVAGVLFAGILFGHFQLVPNHEVMDFAKEFGLILFVYTIGLQVGPGFIGSLRRQGLPLNSLAAGVVVLGALLTVLISRWAGIDMAAAVGLFSGATTNTPSLAAAQEALRQIPHLDENSRKLPGLAYAMAYPFGILGIILTMLVVKWILRVDVAAELAAWQKLRETEDNPRPTTLNLEITNPNLDGLPLEKIPGLGNSDVVVSRIVRGDEVMVAKPGTVVRLHDVLLAVGPPLHLEALRLTAGRESSVDPKRVPSRIVSKRIIVTKKGVLGKTVQELESLKTYGVTITRVGRAEVELAASPLVRLQYGDAVLAVGEEAALTHVARELGNSPKSLDHPEVIPIFVGIFLGVVLGSIPFHIPGMPAAVKLGLAGGPLLVALILSRIGKFGPLVWYMPMSANFMMREFGIILFLACVGLKSGDRFLEVLLHGGGWQWMVWGAVITLVPLLVVACIGRLFMKLNYLTLCGLLAGSMTDPPALAFAHSVARNDSPAVAYATVYPLVMILRVCCAQILVLFFL
jgi:putative transport protein